MNNNVFRAIDKYKMINYGERIVVGVSGGADSMALLHFLRFNCKYKPKLTVCHINHCLRGDESDSDENYVRNICKEWNIDFELFVCDVARLSKENGQSVEEYARKIRYEFFEKIADGDKIATAHTLSDSAETLLFNIARGSSVSGIKSIPQVRGNIIRPLIFATRGMIERYCSENNIKYVTDSTNLTDEYSRNKIRHNVIPVLSEINPAFESAVSRLIESAEADNDYFTQIVNSVLSKAHNIAVNKNISCSGKTAYDITALSKQHTAILSRCVSSLLKEIGCPQTNDRITSICNLVYEGYGKINLQGDLFALIRGGNLYIESIKSLEYFEYPIYDRNELDLILKSDNNEKHSKKINIDGTKEFIITVYNYEDYEILKNIHKKVLYLVFDCDKILDKIVIRQKKDGDSLKLRGMTRTVKKLFNEKKLSAYEKSVVPIVADKDGVIGVYGFGVDDRVAISDKTKKALVFQCDINGEK